MPPIAIPKLAGSHFTSILFELYIQLENMDDTVRERLDSWFSSYEGPLVSRRVGGEMATLKSAYGDGWLAELLIEKETFENCDAVAPVIESDLVHVFDAIVGVPAGLSVSATYAFSRAELPPHGVVNRMIGVQTSVQGTGLLLSGARFTIRGSAEDSVSWFLSRRGEVQGTITQFHSDPFQTSHFLDAAQRAESALRKLILEEQLAELAHGRTLAPA